MTIKSEKIVRNLINDWGYAYFLIVSNNKGIPHTINPYWLKVSEFEKHVKQFEKINDFLVFRKYLIQHNLINVFHKHHHIYFNSNQFLLFCIDFLETIQYLKKHKYHYAYFYDLSNGVVIVYNKKS